MKILNVEPKGYSRQAYGILRKIGEVVEEECDRDKLLLMIPEFDVLIVRLGHKIDAEVFDAGAKLKVVVTATTGLNHIDLKEASRRGVEVLCLKGERQFLDGLTATAELTWALLLGLIRRVPEAHQHVISGKWDRDLFRGRQLQGKALGIIGFGRLGGIVADYGRAFRMRVRAFDPYVESMPPWVERLEFDELLQCADVLSLHVHLDDATSGMLGRDAFSRLKPGALLVNTSRGELIDEKAMLEALDSGRLAGVGLDVLDGEAQSHPDWPKNNLVWRYAQTHDNVLIVPHVGGATLESMEDAEMFMARKLERYLRGEV